MGRPRGRYGAEIQARNRQIQAQAKKKEKKNTPVDNVGLKGSVRRVSQRGAKVALDGAEPDDDVVAGLGDLRGGPGPLVGKRVNRDVREFVLQRRERERERESARAGGKE